MNEFKSNCNYSDYFICDLPYATVLIVLLYSSKKKIILKKNTHTLSLFVLPSVCVFSMPAFVTFFSVVSSNCETLRVFLQMIHFCNKLQ